MTKLIKSIAIAAFMAFYTAGAAHAGGLDGAFNSLLGSGEANVNKPGRYQSQARNIQYFGSMSVRFPISGNIRFVTMSTPRIDAGCHGIDVHLGAIQWISLDKIVEVIEQTARNAIGPIIMMAMEWLFPSLAATVNDWIAKIQEALSMMTNSCALATSLVGSANEWAKAKYADTYAVSQQSCSQLAQRWNWCSDEADCKSTCEGPKIGKKMSESWKRFTSSEKQMEGLNKPEFMNTTWVGFRATGLVGLNITDTTKTEAQQEADLASIDALTGYVLGELLMSHTGTYIPTRLPDDSEPDDDADITPKHIEGRLPADALLEIFMCGSEYFVGTAPPATSVDKAWWDYCDEIFSTSSSGPNPNPHAYRMNRCGIGGASMLEKMHCLRITTPTLKEYLEDDPRARAALSGGFLRLVRQTLEGAVDDVVKDVEVREEARRLISISPFPLYKAINLAAVYPSISRELITNYSETLAFYLAQQYFHHAITSARRHTSAEGLPVSSDVVELAQTASANIQQKISTKFQQIQSQMQYIEAIQAQVQQIEGAILNSIYHRDLLGNQAFSRDIASGGQG